MWKNQILRRYYEFGFAIDEAFARPAPIALNCERIYSTQELRTPYQFENDTLWKIGSRSEITKITTNSVDIVARTPTFDDGRARRLEDFAIDANNHVWIATWEGIARFDSEEWRWFGTEDGLPDTFTSAIAMTEDRRLWAITIEGFAWFEPDTQKWQPYEAKNGQLDTGSHPTFVHLASGAVWFLSGTQLYQYRPENDEGFWWEEVTDIHSDPSVLDVAYEAKGVTEKAFWLFGWYNDLHTLGYINTDTGERYALNAEETNGAMPDDYIAGYVPESDISVWVSFEYEGLYRFQWGEDGLGRWQQYVLQFGDDLYVRDPVNDSMIVPVGIDSTGRLWIVNQKGTSLCIVPSE